MNCDHDFIIIKKKTKLLGSTVCVCVYCDQVREVYEDGKIVIIKDQGEVKRL